MKLRCSLSFPSRVFRGSCAAALKQVKAAGPDSYAQMNAIVNGRFSRRSNRASSLETEPEDCSSDLVSFFVIPKEASCGSKIDLTNF